MDACLLGRPAEAGLGEPRRQRGTPALPADVIVTRERYHRGLRRVFYLAALSSIKPDGPSWTFYQRKRAQGKIHTQALIALARRLVDVVWAVMRNQREFQTTAPLKALAAA
jgi:hypothetical protein